MKCAGCGHETVGNEIHCCEKDGHMYIASNVDLADTMEPNQNLEIGENKSEPYRVEFYSDRP